MKILKMVYSVILFGILGSHVLLAQNLTLNANLLETNFKDDSNPTHLNFITGNRLIFNSKYGVAIKDSEGVKSKLLIKISSAYKNYVNEDNVYTYDAAKALYISVIDNNAYFFIKKNSKLSLWKTNGTNSGTILIKEFPNPNFMTSDFVITSFTKFNSKLFFNIYHMFGNPSRSEFWISDETTAGTEIVNTLNNNSTLSAGNYTQAANSLYFTNYSSNAYWEKKIWKSDGTTAGTLPVFTGIQDDFSIVGNIVNFNGHIYFIKSKNNNSYLSYFEYNTNTVTDVMNLPGNPGTNSNLFLQNNSLVFANNNVLWKSDGTAAGTHTITSSSFPNYGNIGISDMIVFKNKIYFDCYLGSSTEYAKLVYDGNSLAKFSNLFPELATASMEKKSTAYNGESNYLIFLKYNNSNKEYFAFDGQSSKKIQNLEFDYNSGFEINVVDTPDNNLLINAKNKKYGQEIFKFNFGNGTSGIYENANSSGGSYFYSPQELNNKLFYFGSDEYGVGPMLSDGSVAGTKKINENITVQINSGSSYVKNIPNIKVNDKIYFPCTINSSDLELCVSDGTAAGTHQVKDINPNGSGLTYDTPYFFKLGLNKFLFKANDGTGEKLWVSDGTNAGTSVVSSYVSSNEKYAKLNNTTFFTSYDNTLNKAVLMSTDGTQANTSIFHDFGAKRNIVSVLGSTDNKFFCLVYNQIDYWTSNYEVWISDGTMNGTVMLKAFSNPHYSNPGFNTNVAMHNNKLYFYACAENQSNLTLHAPYVSDGTVIGTHKISNEEFANGSYPAYPYSSSFIASCSDKVYFMQVPSNYGYSSMWVYNNNQFNNIYTHPVPNVSLFMQDSSQCINDNLFFLNKQYTENKIWITNGVSGIKEVDIQANGTMANNVIINGLAKLNDKLFLNAPFMDSDNFNFYGNELYVMDVSQITLGTNEVIGSNKNSELSILIFPNPTVSEVNLVAAKNDYIKSVELYNMSGNLILNKTQINNSKITLDMNPQMTGVYLLKIQTEKGTIIKKLIKK